jgi:hypothetical protein
MRRTLCVAPPVLCRYLLTLWSHASQSRSGQIFVTCWNCYDMEAAAAHEIGHLLGLGHPELLPRETLGGFTPTGQNSYHVDLASGARFNNDSCVNPWAGVRQGVPENATTDPRWTRQVDLVRPSIMFDFSIHHPKSCLEADDLEALNVLYPDCHGGPTEPQCVKPPLFLGWVRVGLAIFSFLFCYFVCVMGRWWARYVRGDYKVKYYEMRLQFEHVKRRVKTKTAKARAYASAVEASEANEATLRLKSNEMQAEDPPSPQRPLALPAPRPVAATEL